MWFVQEGGEPDNASVQKTWDGFGKLEKDYARLGKGMVGMVFCSRSGLEQERKPYAEAGLRLG